MKSVLWNMKMFKSSNDSNTSLNSTHSVSHPTPLPITSNNCSNASTILSQHNRSTPNLESFNVTSTRPLPSASSSTIPSTTAAATTSNPSASLPFNNTSSPPKKQRGMFFGFQNSSVQSLLQMTFHSNSSDRELSSSSSSKAGPLDSLVHCNKAEMVDSQAATSSSASSASRSVLMESTTIYYHPPPPKQEYEEEDKLEGMKAMRTTENKKGKLKTRSNRDEPPEIYSYDQSRKQQHTQKQQNNCGQCHHHHGPSKDHLLSLALFDSMDELRRRRRDLGQLVAGRLSAPDIRTATSSSMAPTRQASPTPTHYSQQEYHSASVNSAAWHTMSQIQHHRRDCEYALQLQQKQQKNLNENEGAPGVIASLVDWKVNQPRQQQQHDQRRPFLDKQLPDLPVQVAIAKVSTGSRNQRRRSQTTATGNAKGVPDGLPPPKQPVAPPRPPPPQLPSSIFAPGMTTTQRSRSSSTIKPRIKVGNANVPTLSALTSPPPTTPLPPTPASKLQAPLLPSPLPSDRLDVFFPPPPPPSTKPVVPTVDTSISCSSSPSLSPSSSLSTGEPRIDNLVKVVDSLSDTVETLQRKIAMMLMLEEQANASPGTTINLIEREPGTGRHQSEMMKNRICKRTIAGASVGDSSGSREAQTFNIQSASTGGGCALGRRSTTAHCLMSGVESQARRNIRGSTQWTTSTVRSDPTVIAECVTVVGTGISASSLTASLAATLSSSIPSATTFIPATTGSPVPVRPSRPDGSSQELKEALEVIDSRLVLLQYEWPQIPSIATTDARTTEPRAVTAPSSEAGISPPSSSSFTRSSSSTFLRPPPPPSILTAPTTTPSGHLAPASPAPRSSTSPLSQSTAYPCLSTSQFLFPPPPALPLPSLPAPPPFPDETLQGNKAASSYACELVRKNTRRCQTLDDELQCMVNRLQSELRQQYRRQQQRRRFHELELAAALGSKPNIGLSATTTTAMGERRGSWKARPTRTASLTLSDAPPSQESQLEKSASRRGDYRRRGRITPLTSAAVASSATAVDSENEDDYLLDCGPETRQLLDSIEEIRKRVLEVGRLGVGMGFGIGMKSSSPPSSAYPCNHPKI